MMIIQICSLLHLIYCVKKFGKVFDSMLSFLNHVTLEITIFVLLLICLSVYANQGNLQNYRKSSEVLKTSSIEIFLNLVLVGCLVASVVIELIRMVINAVKMIKVMIEKLKNGGEKTELKKSQLRSVKIKRTNKIKRNEIDIGEKSDNEGPLAEKNEPLKENI
jgi:hypothetical protein